MFDALTFFKNFVTRFHHTGAVAPSSTLLARSIVERVGPSAGPLDVLEVGPGTGPFTRALAARLKPGDRLDLYEINEEFCEALRRNVLPLLPGVEVTLVCADILKAVPERRYDAIVSGLPFNNFEPRVVEAILSLYVRLVKPGGSISFFEYLGVRPAKLRLLPAGPERDRLGRIDGIVRAFRDRFGAGETRVHLNLPPARVVHLRR